MDKIKILHGNVFDKVKELNDNSIDCVVTSPPYWGLRDYGTGTWIGGDKNCPHKRLTKISKDTKTGHAGMFKKGNVVGDAIYKNYCPECGAKRKDEQLGLEETYQEHIKNIVNLFEEIKPKLKESATIWINYGDSYATTINGRKAKDVKNDDRMFVDKPFSTIQGSIKPKDLVMIPNRIAIALQDAGWYIRSEIIWHKPNPMPESVRDRPTSAHEKIWLITKSKKYYYDADSIREPLASTSLTRLNQDIKNQKGSTRGNGGMKSNGNMKAVGNLETKNKRNVWTITTKPCKEAHFATFPKDLIEPCIKAGCPEGGIVLDPFGGSGTTGIVASQNNRNAILIELNKDYIDIANKRIHKELGLFNVKS
jgi:DNA modification methylase